LGDVQLGHLPTPVNYNKRQNLQGEEVFNLLAGFNPSANMLLLVIFPFLWLTINKKNNNPAI